MFKVFLNDPSAAVPVRADIGAAGYDLFSVDKMVIPPHSQGMIDTGIVLEFPSDCYARVAPRSGLAAKHSIDVLAGVIDSTYRGNIKVILFNHSSDREFIVNVGDRVAQIIFERIYTPVLEEVDDVTHLKTTSRDQGGFGSTGR